MDGGQNR
jgi:hypothetical protein